MDDVEAEPSEALFLVLASLVRKLAQSGVVDVSTFETMRDAFTMQAEGTINTQRRADCSLAAEYAEVLSIAASDEPTHQPGPRLRLVEDDEGDPSPR